MRVPTVTQHIKISGGSVENIIGTQIQQIRQEVQRIDTAVLAREVADEVLRQLDTAERGVVVGRALAAVRRDTAGTSAQLDTAGKAIATAHGQLVAAADQAQAGFVAAARNIAQELERPAEARDPAALAGRLARAQQLLIGAAALAAVVADLSITGGLITLSALSYGAGHQLAIAQRAGGACTCGRLVADAN